MTTENTEIIETNPRPLSILLELGTYQGMTDEEIESILQFKIFNEVERRFSEGETTIISNATEEVIANERATTQAITSMLQSILNRGPVLTSVGGVQ